MKEDTVWTDYGVMNELSLRGGAHCPLDFSLGSFNFIIYAYCIASNQKEKLQNNTKRSRKTIAYGNIAKTTEF